MGAQAKNSIRERCDLTDAVFCEAESGLNLENSNLRKITKPVVSITWGFLDEGHFAQIICEKLKENGIVPLKFQAVPAGVNPSLVVKEVEEVFSSFENVQILSARSIGEKLLFFRSSNGEIDKIYKQASSISKFANAHLLPGGEDIEPELYGEEFSIPKESMPKILNDLQITQKEFLVKIERYLRSNRRYTKSLLELSILHHADLASQKILAICRGLQAVNTFQGGTLRQHVSGQEGVQALRSTPLASPRVEQLKNEFFGPGEIHAYSMHHQCAEKIGKGLHVLYESKEGVPKAMVHENGRVVATQFHPEMYDDEDAIKEDPSFLKSAPYFRGLFQWLARSNQSEARL